MEWVVFGKSENKISGFETDHKTNWELDIARELECSTFSFSYPFSALSNSTLTPGFIPSN